MKIYAMSDIHGYFEEFKKALSLVDLSNDNKLILLGDYIHGPKSYEVLDKIMLLQEKYGSKKVIALIGNHEEMAITNRYPINCEKYDVKKDNKYLAWMKKLPKYYEFTNQIFCHAGIDEEAGDMWKIGTDDYTFIEKYPAQIGTFYKDIIAGHIGTSTIANNPNFHNIFFDGKNHYYIDGTVSVSGVIPVIMVNIDTNKYYCLDENGINLILPYDEIKHYYK